MGRESEARRVGRSVREGERGRENGKESVREGM